MNKPELKKENKFLLGELSKELGEELIMFEFIGSKGLFDEYNEFAERRRVEMKRRGM